MWLQWRVSRGLVWVCRAVPHLVGEFFTGSLWPTALVRVQRILFWILNFLMHCRSALTGVLQCLTGVISWLAVVSSPWIAWQWVAVGSASSFPVNLWVRFAGIGFAEPVLTYVSLADLHQCSGLGNSLQHCRETWADSLEFSFNYYFRFSIVVLSPAHYWDCSCLSVRWLGLFSPSLVWQDWTIFIEEKSKYFYFS